MTPNTTRLIKIGADGKRAAADATDHIALLDRAPQFDGSHLLWSAATNGSKSVTWKTADKTARAVALLGFADWRLPTVEELFAIADRTRIRPAIDVSLFADTRSDWYWTSSAWANSPDGYAWIVGFGNGDSGSFHRGYQAFVRAVRAVSPGQFSAFDIDADGVLSP